MTSRLFYSPIAGILLILLLPDGALAQHPVRTSTAWTIGEQVEKPESKRRPESEDAPIRTSDKICDPVWDGALFGILPGVFVGMLHAVYRPDTSNPGSGVGSIALGAAGGAAVGAVMDELNCAQPEPE